MIDELSLYCEDLNKGQENNLNIPQLTEKRIKIYFKLVKGVIKAPAMPERLKM
jgi:hypothetical protein